MLNVSFHGVQEAMNLASIANDWKPAVQYFNFQVICLLCEFFLPPRRLKYNNLLKYVLTQKDQPSKHKKVSTSGVQTEISS